MFIGSQPGRRFCTFPSPSSPFDDQCCLVEELCKRSDCDVWQGIVSFGKTTHEPGCYIQAFDRVFEQALEDLKLTIQCIKIIHAIHNDYDRTTKETYNFRLQPNGQFRYKDAQWSGLIFEVGTAQDAMFPNSKENKIIYTIYGAGIPVILLRLCTSQ